jgi:hypothetical protein
MQRLVIVWVVVLGACAQTVADDAVRLCQPLCGCSEDPLPSTQRTCVAGCTVQFERTPLPEFCIECIVEHADRCATLLDDCVPRCSDDMPLGSYLDAAPPSATDR